MISPGLARQYYFFSGVIIVSLCLGLFYLDKDTHAISDLFKPGNLFALILYVVPTYLICLLLYEIFRRRKSKSSFVLALCIGVPIRFALVMLIMFFSMTC